MWRIKYYFVPKYNISRGPAPADLTALQQPLCSFYQFAFHHAQYKQSSILKAVSMN